jgi:lipopolysaccharide/colanic/teichoic acid biosynthesis glycosyltransferase
MGKNAFSIHSQPAGKDELAKLSESLRLNWTVAGPPSSRFERDLAPAQNASRSNLRDRSAAVFQSASRSVFDRICAAAGLALLSPAFAMIALAIKLDDGGPIFYSQFRAGKGFQKFRLLKFRSMTSQFAAGSPVALPDDPRITRVGRFLRHYKLDELPQLVNVLKGEMQLVGARPPLARHAELFQREFGVLLQVPPGITDLASLCFRNEIQMFQKDGPVEEQYIARILPSKLQMSLKYYRERTFFSDLGILFRTVLGMKSPARFREVTLP